jgi:hypothetical protein
MTKQPVRSPWRAPGIQRVARGSAVMGLVGGTVLLSMTAAAPGASAAVNLCGHPADTVPPVISAVTFSSPTASTTNGSTSVTVTADASDTATSGTGSGVRHIDAYLEGPHNSEAPVSFTLASGTRQSGVWTGEAVFTQHDWPGAYVLRDVSVNDAAGNYEDYPNYGSTAAAPTAISLQTGWDSQLTLTGPTPTKPTTVPAGQLAGFTVSSTTADTTRSTKTIVVTARFNGHRPARAYAYFFASPKSGELDHYLQLSARLRPAGDTWRGRFTVPRWVGDVTLKASLEADYSHNVRPEYRTWDTAKLQSLGFPTTIGVTSGVDISRPQLSGLTLTPDSIDTTTGAQTVAITATASDAGSGVKTIEVSFDKSSGFHVVFASGSNAAGAASIAGPGKLGIYQDGGDVNVRLTRSQGASWTGTATFRECVPNGKWHVSADVVDRAGNDGYSSSATLAKLNLPSTLQVAAAPQYVYDPVVTAATAAGAYHQITLDFDEGVQNLTTSNLTAYGVSAASTRYQQPLTISAIACSNGKQIIDCSGSAGLITSAVLTIPKVTGGLSYEVWADLDATTSQITDAGGLPVSWQYAIAQVQGA